MDLVYSLSALAVLVIAWIAVRRIVGRPRRRLKKYSKWRERQRETTTQHTQTGSKRSDMRAYNDPTTTMSTLEKGRWKGGTSSSGGRNTGARKKKK